VEIDDAGLPDDALGWLSIMTIPTADQRIERCTPEGSPLRDAPRCVHLEK
jgi:hypothetical protein